MSGSQLVQPKISLLNLACAELMAHYRLPHGGTSGSGTGWRPDLLAAETYWMNHLTSLMGMAGLPPFVGDILGSKTFSATNVVYVHEIVDLQWQYTQHLLDTLQPPEDHAELLSRGEAYIKRRSGA